jgi:glycine cleavage system regulatory protein
MPSFRVVWDEVTTVEATLEAKTQERGYELEIDRYSLNDSFRAEEDELE